MKSRLRKCRNCGRYTLKESCPVCKQKTISPIPPKFSIEDRYGKYRRKLRMEKGFFSFKD
ncbi:RNA-protein complex protein Nop10 [Archaeoglobus sulfaticallidus]|uniref:RNA-protein complex protein Nop10 n=1 Tax=Archaeoglobus sulfaticallidus TaxID=1316941 RepID=UPI0009D99E9B|nr:RNA-protein complex protein Nop10 [Archaeoglobus sulfaticallidus]